MRNLWNRLGWLTKGIIILVVCVGAFFALKPLVSNETTSNEGGGFSLFGGSGKTITLAVDSYLGWEPIMWVNNGTEPKKDCKFYELTGYQLKIVVMDDFGAQRAALKGGEIDMAFVTLESYPTETGSAGDMKDEFKYFMIHNYSVGADAIVVRKGINSVADLRGKTICYTPGTASHALLLRTLEAEGMTMKDIVSKEVEYGESAKVFKAGQVDATVVYSPDDEDCVAALPGAHILMSTAKATNLITDGFIASEKFLNKNHDKVKKFIEAMLWANSEITNNPEALESAHKSIMDALQMPASDLEMVKTVTSKIKFATLADNVNWFSLNPYFQGQTAENLYSKMLIVYTDLGLAKSAMAWNKVSNSTFIEELMEKNDISNDQTENASKATEFKAATKEMEKAPAVSDKKVIINFPTDGYTLDDEAKFIIKREFVNTAKEFDKMRIRVEGNTDNTGNSAHNYELSKKRAQAVVDYLVKEEGISKNRFVVVGNGPEHAIKDGVQGSNENYRTTDFMLFNE